MKPLHWVVDELLSKHIPLRVEQKPSPYIERLMERMISLGAFNPDFFRERIRQECEPYVKR